MAVKHEDVIARWTSIRENRECDLAVTSENVASFLGASESESVAQKIRDSLTHLADWRLEAEQFENEEEGGARAGALATCEGLEAFLVPAVEGALPMSAFLTGYSQSDSLAEALVADVKGLVKGWQKDGFTGEPYATKLEIKKALDAVKGKQARKLNITEAAAVATRVIIHLLTLQFHHTKDEALFKEKIGEELDFEVLLACLADAIHFLVDAFQASRDEENAIGSATVSGLEGSGWSWTAYPGLSPMLFFTAAAVDAFAELDLYLIRPATLLKRNECPRDLRVFYDTHEVVLSKYQFCVDMARRWAVNEVLPNISTGLGFYGQVQEEASGRALVQMPDPKQFETYEADLKRVAANENDEELADEPTRLFLLYNNLYALTTLLWTFSDWDDQGKEKESSIAASIERALLQLVYNYKIPVWREVLDAFPFVFNLYAGDLFGKGKSVTYMDSGFGTQLARLIIFYGVYGVGDRTVMDPLAQELYIDLLMNRYRNDADSAYLWSSRQREVFSTQRAIQVLTFYNAYAKGREKAYGASGLGSGKEGMAGFFRQVADFLSGTSTPGQVVQEHAGGEPAPPNPPEPPVPPEPKIVEAKDLAAYGRSIKKPMHRMTDTLMEDVEDIMRIGTDILDRHQAREIPFDDANPFLDGCSDFLNRPYEKNGKKREAFEKNLKTEYDALLGRYVQQKKGK